MRNFLLFAVTAALTTLGLGRLLPPIQRAALRVKLEAFSRLENEIDVLVLGSSMSYRGLDPEAFDRHNRAAGLATRTFNLALPGTCMIESYAMLRRVAELEPRRLRYVLIEADQVTRLHDEAEYLTVKNIAYHDVATTRAEWPHLSELASDPWDLWGARWRRLVATTYHVLGIGRGVPWAEAAIGMGVTAKQRASWLGPRGDGFFLLEDDLGGSLTRRRRQFERLAATYDRNLRRLPRMAPPLGEALTSARPLFTRVEELARSMGARAVFYSIRSGYMGGAATNLAEHGLLDSLLRFDDALAYPELYDGSFTFDGKHFNRAGAAVFTRYLSRAFVDLVETSQP